MLPSTKAWSAGTGAGVVAAIIAVIVPVAAGVTASLPVQLISTERVLAVEAEPIELADGIALTPVDGWTVESQDDGEVLLVNDDENATFHVIVGKADSKDVEEELQADIQDYTEENGFSNIDFSETWVERPAGKNFKVYAQVAFGADLATQQGSTTVYGNFFELLNAATGMSAFIAVVAAEEAWEGVKPDIGPMVQSMY